MAFDWITLLISLGIGLVGGLLSGTITTVASRIALKRKINTELNKMQHFGKETTICCYCKREVPKEACFCVFCGKVVAGKMMCEECCIALPDDAKFCYRCHAKAIPRPIHKIKDKKEEEN